MWLNDRKNVIIIKTIKLKASLARTHMHTVCVLWHHKCTPKRCNNLFFLLIILITTRKKLINKIACHIPVIIIIIIISAFMTCISGCDLLCTQVYVCVSFSSVKEKHLIQQFMKVFNYFMRMWMRGQRCAINCSKWMSFLWMSQ